MNDDIKNSYFKYRAVYEKGKPTHDRYDSFSIRHPSMDLARRAKIFTPFDALKGFGEELLKVERAAEECDENGKS